MVIANFEQGQTTKIVRGLKQWDYGQVLRIQGLSLPTAVEIHFSLQENRGDCKNRIGVTRDGVTDVIIPESMLENEGATGKEYYIYVWVYMTDETSGQTEYSIKLSVETRSKPEAFDRPEDAELFREAIKAVNECADRAESWAHGHEDYPERNKDNAKYYAGKAKDIVAEIHVQVEDAKEHIDGYVSGKKEELKGDTGNVYFAAFKVVNGRLKMYSDPDIDKVRFVRIGSRLLYRLNF